MVLFITLIVILGAISLGFGVLLYVVYARYVSERKKFVQLERKSINRMETVFESLYNITGYAKKIKDPLEAFKMERNCRRVELFSNNRMAVINTLNWFGENLIEEDYKYIERAQKYGSITRNDDEVQKLLTHIKKVKHMSKKFQEAKIKILKEYRSVDENTIIFIGDEEYIVRNLLKEIENETEVGVEQIELQIRTEEYVL